MAPAVTATSISGPVLIRPLESRDYTSAREICGRAFCAFLNFPDPENFWRGKDYVRARHNSKACVALAAEYQGELAGSNFLTRWGSFGFFGPLTVRPDLWDAGIAKRLLAATVEQFEAWELHDAGLYTFPHSLKHVGLYQKFGFWPRFLTAIMTKEPVASATRAVLYSSLNADQRAEAGRACSHLTNTIHEGLDLAHEIESLHRQNLGEVVLLWNGSKVESFAICHCGPGTEAGFDTCYIKFAAVRGSVSSEESLDQLLAACENMAVSRGLTRMEFGVNTARIRAYRRLLHLGYRNMTQGVAMQKPDSPGYNRPEVFILDDWR